MSKISSSPISFFFAFFAGVCFLYFIAVFFFRFFAFFFFAANGAHCIDMNLFAFVLFVFFHKDFNAKGILSIIKMETTAMPTRAIRLTEKSKNFKRGRETK